MNYDELESQILKAIEIQTPKFAQTDANPEFAQLEKDTFIQFLLLTNSIG